IPGVGAVILVGGRQRAVNVVVDPDRLSGYEGLSVADVRQALARENQEQPGGRVDQGRRELNLRTEGRVSRAQDFADLIVTHRRTQMRPGDLSDLFLGKPRDAGEGRPVRIADVGYVQDGYEEERGRSRLWVRGRSPEDRPGEQAVTLIVQKQSGSNTVAVVAAVKKRLG